TVGQTGQNQRDILDVLDIDAAFFYVCVGVQQQQQFLNQKRLEHHAFDFLLVRRQGKVNPSLEHLTGQIGAGQIDNLQNYGGVALLDLMDERQGQHACRTGR